MLLINREKRKTWRLAYIETSFPCGVLEKDLTDMSIQNLFLSHFGTANARLH